MDDNRLISKNDITNFNLRKWESMGLKPYYYNRDEESDDFGMNQITDIPKKSEDNHIRDIFLLSESDMEKVEKMTNETKKLVSLYKRKINLIKDYIQSIALEGDM